MIHIISVIVQYNIKKTVKQMIIANEETLPTDYSEGMASPTYYCFRNTQMPEEKSWNKNKVLQHSNTDYTDYIIKNNSCNSWAKENKGGKKW
jgi:hypothetical protein